MMASLSFILFGHHHTEGGVSNTGTGQKKNEEVIHNPPACSEGPVQASGEGV
jgi:hypothetical protein